MAKCSAVIDLACTEFCSRCERQNCAVSFLEISLPVCLNFNVMFGCTHFFKTLHLLYASSKKCFATLYAVLLMTHSTTESHFLPC